MRVDALSVGSIAVYAVPNEKKHTDYQYRPLTTTSTTASNRSYYSGDNYEATKEHYDNTTQHGW